MKALIQRVKRAAVTIDGSLYSSIGYGLLVFVGVEKSDDKFNAEKLVDKILKLRIFDIFSYVQHIQQIFTELKWYEKMY